MSEDIGISHGLSKFFQEDKYKYASQAGAPPEQDEVILEDDDTGPPPNYRT
jgi:hypothetical protein